MKTVSGYRRNRWSKHLVIVAAAALVGSMYSITSSSAYAGSRNWTGAAHANWNLAGNWSPAGVPQFQDDAVIFASAGANKSVTYDHDGSQQMLNLVRVDSSSSTAVAAVNQDGGWLATSGLSIGAGGMGQYMLNNGTLAVSGPLEIGHFQSGNGLFELNNGLLGAHSVTLGVSSGKGFFRQNNGRHQVATLTLGAQTVSAGTYNMNGGTLVVGQTMYIGDKSTGSFGMSGGKIETKQLIVGNHGASNGEFVQTGGFSHVLAQDRVTIGAATFSSGTYSLNGGSMVTLSTRVGDAGFGTMNVGAAQLISNEILIGNTPGGVGYFQTGGGVNAIYTMVSNIGATGTVRQFGGTFHSTTVDIGQHLGSNGRYDLFGGHLNAGTLNIGANNGGGFFAHNSGTVSSGSTTIGTNAKYWMTGGTLNVTAMKNDGSFAASAGYGSFGTMMSGTGSTTVSGSAQLHANHFTQRSAHFNGGTVSMRDRAQGGFGAKLRQLTFATNNDGSPNGAFDLADTALMITDMSQGEVTDRVRWGRNHGAWNGQGITSRTARTTPGTTLGVLAGHQFISVFGPGGSFVGQGVLSGDVLVKYTYYGDSDFNGIVNFDDYARIDNGFSTTTGNEWFEGDFDLNGVVNFDDYALIDLGFNTQSGSLARAMSFLDGSDRSADSMDTPALRKVEQHFAQFGQVYASGFLNAVPEPSAVLAMIGVSCGMGLRRRVRAS